MLSFDDPNRNRYRYRLDGFDPEWVEAGSRREATYTNLDPGRYVFRVKASNPDGVWNENEASLAISIAPPFWQTWWFLTTVVLLCGGGLSGVIVYRVRQLLKIERLRMQIAADLHDSIGTGLTEISILSEVGSQQKATDSASAREWFDKIGETARTLGQSMSDVIWLINPKYDSVGDIILQLKKSYDEIFFHSNIVFRAPSAADWNSVHLPIEHRKHLYLVLKEAINNSLKHSHCKTILVEAESNDRLLHIRYADDGIGFDSACQFDGNGLYNIKQRIVAIGGSITNDSQVGKGSCLTITLPGSFRKTGGAE
jgi:signal transduction histidine kinase